MTSDNVAIQSNNFNVDKYGNVVITDTGASNNASLKIQHGNEKLNLFSDMVVFQGGDGNVQITNDGAILSEDDENGTTSIYGSHFNVSNGDGTGTFFVSPNYTYVLDLRYVHMQQFSLEKLKKNIEKSNVKALDIIKKARIYEYNLKTEEDTDKKHIGFIIGDKYETPKELISQDGQGIDTYTMSSIMWKAIQEQQKMIEDLQKEIKLLKGEKDE